MDWQAVWIKHDSSNFYFRLQNQMPIAFNYGMQFFIDADNNPNTGYIGTGGEFNIGADYLVQGYSDPRRLSENREPTAEKPFWSDFPIIFVK